MPANMQEHMSHTLTNLSHTHTHTRTHTHKRGLKIDVSNTSATDNEVTVRDNRYLFHLTQTLQLTKTVFLIFEDTSLILI